MAHFLRSEKIFNNQDLIHIIGDGSPYDDGMETIEMFVRHHRNPEKEQYKYALMNYYISNLLNYWNGLEDLLKTDVNWVKWNSKITSVTPILTIKQNRSKYISVIGKTYESASIDLSQLEKKYTTYYDLILHEFPNAIASLDKNYRNEYNSFVKFNFSKDNVFVKRAASVIRGKEIKFIEENMETYYEYFTVLLDDIRNTFSENSITKAFYFITSLLCFNPGGALHQNLGPTSEFNKIKKKSYFLANYTGFHSFNTYLYGIISGISIIGVPGYTLQEYDNLVGCPVHFLDHDIGHEFGVHIKYTHNKEYYETLYYKILRNTLYNREMKELMIFVLWFDIHEQPIALNETLEKYYRAITNPPKDNDIDYLFPRGSLDNLLALIDINLVRTYFPAIEEKSYKNILLFGYIEAQRLMQE